MNERLEQLLVKAGMQFRLDNIPTHIASNGTHTFNEFYVYDKFDPEKFAELIVGECIDVVEQAKNDPFVSLDDAKRMKHFADVTKKKIERTFRS